MGPSEAVDPDVFAWTDVDWLGVGSNDQVLYEMHVGTFTKEGTWRAAIEQLPALAELGITIIEMMPVADFAGRIRLGIRWRRPVRADAAVRRPGRPARLRRRRAPGGARRDPGRRLQSPGSIRKLPAQIREELFLRANH